MLEDLCARQSSHWTAHIEDRLRSGKAFMLLRYASSDGACLPRHSPRAVPLRTAHIPSYAGPGIVHALDGAHARTGLVSHARPDGTAPEQFTCLDGARSSGVRCPHLALTGGVSAHTEPYRWPAIFTYVLVIYQSLIGKRYNV